MHASKLINGFEGGYLTTNDINLAERLSILRGFGFLGPDRVLELGTNAKLNEMHAAMALASLDDLEAQVERNRERYCIYQRLLADLDGIRLLTFDESEQTSYKNIVVELTEAWPLTRAQTIRYLNSEGMLARAYYSPPLHCKTTEYPVISSAMPLTERLAERFLLLPCGHLTSTEDIPAVVDFLRFLKIHSQKIQEARI
jgi:dTDP-4-amino-4,6-dideoxygalactose transaminase